MLKYKGHVQPTDLTPAVIYEDCPIFTTGSWRIFGGIDWANPEDPSIFFKPEWIRNAQVSWLKLSPLNQQRWQELMEGTFEVREPDLELLSADLHNHQCRRSPSDLARLTGRPRNRF